MDFGGVLEAESMDSVWEGSKNHAFARIRFFTVSPPIWEPFCSPKRTKDHVLAHFGALGIEFSTSVASTFQQCFSKPCMDSISAKGVQKGRGPVGEGMTPKLFHLPPLTLYPPAAQRPEKQSFPEYIYICVYIYIYIYIHTHV